MGKEKPSESGNTGREARDHEEYLRDPDGYMRRAEETINRMDESEVPRIIEKLRSIGFRQEARVRDNVSELDSRNHELTYYFKKEAQRGIPEMTIEMRVAHNGYWLTVNARSDTYNRTFYNNPVSAENLERYIQQVKENLEFDRRLSRETGFHFDAYQGDRGVFYFREGEGSIPGLALSIDPMPYVSGIEMPESEITIRVPDGSDSQWVNFPRPERFHFDATVTGPDRHAQILRLVHEYVRRVILHQPSQN